MAGHSKWANIKHKKAVKDARRGKLFTKLIKEITVAARMGGGDVNGNPTLYDAVQKARKIADKVKEQSGPETGRADEEHGDQHDDTDGNPAERKTAELMKLANDAADMTALEAAQAQADLHFPALPDDAQVAVNAALDGALKRIERNLATGGEV